MDDAPDSGNSRDAQGTLDALVVRADSDDVSPGEVRIALAELLHRSPAVGAALALDRLAREPRVKPSRRLLIDPLDVARDRWARRVAAAAALVESPAVADVFHELRDELAEDAVFAEDVLNGAAVHSSLPADRRAQLEATRPAAG